MMHTPARFVPALLAVLAALMAIGFVAAGPLNPPAGPISPTYKTLSDIEPRTPIQSLPASPTALFVISKPGSYYLTAPISGVPGRSGIDIAADNVTLDLRGFAITGVPGASDGIRATTPIANLTIAGGVLDNWPGIALNAASASPLALRDIRADRSSSGILAGAAATISRCSARSNALAGIAVGAACLITDSLAQSNGRDGFYLSDSSSADRCIADANGGHGFYLDGDGASVRNSTARSNGAGGVTSIYSCSLDSVAADFNAAAGILSAGPATITRCTAASNDQGGISAADGSVVSSCAARSNTLYGIRVASSCRVEACTCSDTHGFAAGPAPGLLATGPSSRIDSNTLTANDIGLKALAPSNLIIRNDAAGNTTAYDLAPNQSAGPIASDPQTSTNPWTNFSH